MNLNLMKIVVMVVILVGHLKVLEGNPSLFILIQRLTILTYRGAIIFANRKQFKDALVKHLIKNRRNYRLDKNDNDRIKVVCKGVNCKWLILWFINGNSKD